MSQGGAALPDTLLQRAAMNERRVVLAALVIVTALGLWATFHTGDALMSLDSPAPGTVAYAVLLFIMWWTMMLAMMLPSAAPAILTSELEVQKKESKTDRPPILPAPAR